jgi:tRNA (cytidine/uridine-2'-O-)-methyltransferase
VVPRQRPYVATQYGRGAIGFERQRDQGSGIPMRLVLYEPDIAPNAGTMMRLAACLGVALDLIEPSGFVLDDRRLRRAAMDYLDRLELKRHTSFAAFQSWRKAEMPQGRLVLLTTQAPLAYVDFAFRAEDLLMVGRESAGVPEPVHAASDARVRIPLAPGARALNVALAAAMVLGEALRQNHRFPSPGHLPEKQS